ncbi:prefoldin subunit alpha [Patescibacteria group bacterium]|nr:prefoldin subunit alpha [Patescibacteria group bacterium]
MEEKQKELLFRLSMAEQNLKLIEQQLQAVEEGILDINSISLGLDELKGAIGKEILAPVGRGIFVKAKLLSEDLTVDVGGKNFVKKSIPETKEIIKTQSGKLNEIKKDLEKNAREIDQELTEMIIKAQNKNSENPE